MNLTDLSAHALEVADLYREANKKNGHKTRTVEQYMSGMVGDVGDLQKLIMAKCWYRYYEAVDQKIEHELSDVLWSLLVIASTLDIDLEKVFIQTMTSLKERIA